MQRPPLQGPARRARAALVLVALGLAPGAGLAHEAIDASLREIERDVAAHPDDAELVFRRAELHRLRGDLDGARDDYAAARRLDPTLAVVDLALARAELGADPEASLQAVRAYLACVPDSAEGHRVLARALGAAGRPVEAAAAWERVVDLSLPPREPEPDDFLERARLLDGRGHPDEALACLAAGLGRLGPAITLELAALDVELAHGRSAAALARLEALAARSIRKEPWKVRQAEIYESLGRAADARAAYDEARASLASVPAARRAAPATIRIERRIAEGIARLDGAAAERVP